MILQIINRLFKRRILSGLLLILLSYCGFFIDLKNHTIFTSIFFVASYYLGFLLIADALSMRFANVSILSQVYRSQKSKLKFTIITLIGGTLFGFIAADISGFFYYPYWSYADYIIIGYFLGGWTFYFIALIIPYEGMKTVLDKLNPFNKPINKYFKWERYVYILFKYLSVTLIFVSILHVLIDTNLLTTFTLNQQFPKAPLVSHPYLTSFAFFLGIVLFCEFVEYERKRTSFLKDLVHGYWNPLFSLLIVSYIMGITSEIQNTSVYLWRYNNMPFANIQFLSIPLIAIITWPTHILAILELWRAFGDNNSKVVFEEPKQQI